MKNILISAGILLIAFNGFAQQDASDSACQKSIVENDKLRREVDRLKKELAKEHETFTSVKDKWIKCLDELHPDRHKNNDESAAPQSSK